MNRKIENVLIVGGGSAGWMAAAALAKTLDLNTVSITLVESEEIGIVGVGEATIPPILQFNRLVEIDEREFLKQTKATFKLGIEFVNWKEIGNRYLHPFGIFGANIGQLAFHEYWQRLYLNGDAKDISKYSVSCMAAPMNKFCHPNNDGNSPLSQLGYAYHFDASLYAGFLRKLSAKLGVVRVEGKVDRIKNNQNTGEIESIILESGEEIGADLFIDCTGFRSLLLGQNLGIGFRDWSHWLTCDRAIAVPTENTKELAPYTRSTAHEVGWQWRIPLQHRVGNGYVYSSRYLTDDAAHDILSENLQARLLAEPRQLKFKAGRRDRFWVKNCVAIGLSAGFLEPLESTSIHLIQRGIAKLLDYFPARDFNASLKDRYNKELIKEYHQVRNLVILHYKLNQRSDSEFWRYCQAMDIPQSLQHKIDLYQGSGRVYRDDNELFNVTSWVAVMHGQGLRAKSYHPLLDKIPADKLKAHLDEIEKLIAQTARKMPAQQAYLEKYLNLDSQ